MTLNTALLVTPPKGYEIGYVPIVIRQEVPVKALACQDVLGKYEHTPKEND